MRKYIFLLFSSLFFFWTFLSADITTPYGVNSWDTPDWAQDKLEEAGIKIYRDFVIWRHAEPNDLPAGYQQPYNWWTAYCGARIAQRKGFKIMYTVTDPPEWAEIYKIGKQSHINKYCEFINDLLDYVDSIAPGKIHSIDLGNETYVWGDVFDKDPSWYYADLLRAVYAVVKAHNPEILVIPTPVFPDPQFVDGQRPLEWIVDELYQTGCKGYMDRINIHYYVHDMGPARDPMYPAIFHFPTVIRYMKYLAEQNNDPDIMVINTEYGWILNLQEPYLTEQQKAQYFQSILDVSRQSGYCDTPFMYPGESSGYPTSHHSSALIYSADGSSATAVYTDSYYMYKNYSSQYPTWSTGTYTLVPTLPPANYDVTIPNSGFELGNTNGWTGLVISTSQKYSGNYSGLLKVPGVAYNTNPFPVEPSKLYEIRLKLKIDGDVPGNCRVHSIGTMGIDTRNYPNTWRKRRFKYYTGPEESLFTLNIKGLVHSFNSMYFVMVNTGPITGVNQASTTVVGRFRPGDRVYLDLVGNSTFTFSNIPSQLSNLPGIKTANQDTTKDLTDSFLTFNLPQGATVYVAYHQSNELLKIEKLTGINKPLWLASWNDTGLTITATDNMGSTETYKVFSKYFDTGNVVLGANSGSYGNVWIDDIEIKALNMPFPYKTPYISVSPLELDFKTVDIGKTKTLGFDIKNLGTGILTGLIFPDKDWIEVEPASFNSNYVTINVTVNNNILYESAGEFSGNINITSNGGNATVAVKLEATCVIANPNPYCPQDGLLIFKGDGIVPGNTVIKIYNISGELIKILKMQKKSDSENNIITWDGTNTEGKLVNSGIYLYSYESPKEKGTGKITLLNK